MSRVKTVAFSAEHDDLMLAFAAGVLPSAPSLVIASQAAMREDVRRELHDYEAVGGALLEESAPRSLSDGLRDKVLAQLDEPVAPGLPVPVEDGDRRVPTPLWGHVGKRLEDLPWRWVMPGLKDYVFPAGAGGTTRLMWVKGGVRMPAHTHEGMELTLVLQGSFSDQSGLYEPGDLQLADDSIDHRPVAERGESCLCLVVTEAPVRLTGLLGRHLNRFVRY